MSSRTKGNRSNQLPTKADAKVTKRKLAIEFVSDDEEALVKYIEMSKPGQSKPLQYNDDAIDAKRAERKRKRAILYARKECAIEYVSSEDDKETLKSSIPLEKDEDTLKSSIPLEKEDGIASLDLNEIQSAQDPDAWIMNPEMYYFATFGVDKSEDQ